MKGSNVSNIKFDPNKQKIVVCEGCKEEIVVGKFAKNNQRCSQCKNLGKSRKSSNKSQEIIEENKPADEKRRKFGEKLQELCQKLGYEITDRRSWKKRYAIDGGGIATIHIMPEQSNTGMGPRLEYFSLVIQRAVGVNEDFRKFMPPDAVSDCELLASELAVQSSVTPKLGQEQCDKCREYTDEFGVDNKSGKILCVKPNNCFKKSYNRLGAEAAR